MLLGKFINGAIYPRYYYIPGLDSYYEPSAIDFQLIEVKKYTKKLFEGLKEKKIASLKSSWKESIPVRYSSYSSRIGVEDLSQKFIEKIFQSYSINLTRSS